MTVPTTIARAFQRLSARYRPSSVVSRTALWASTEAEYTQDGNADRHPISGQRYLCCCAKESTTSTGLIGSAPSNRCLQSSISLTGLRRRLCPFGVGCCHCDLNRLSSGQKPSYAKSICQPGSGRSCEARGGRGYIALGCRLRCKRGLFEYSQGRARSIVGTEEPAANELGVIGGVWPARIVVRVPVPEALKPTVNRIGQILN
jgi:hypothetical protein